MKKPGISRRRFLGGVSFAAAGTAGYAHWCEAEWLEQNHVAVPISGAARPPLRLLHISDLHASAVVSLGYIGQAIEVALKFQPDLICVTGDFITHFFDDAVGYARILRRLSDAAPCFAVLGNHDGGPWARGYGGYADVQWVSALLRESRVTLLRNGAQNLKVRDWQLNIVGLGDGWAGDLDPATAFRAVSPEQPTVVLSHNPDTKAELAPYRWNLMLSGHTHGGQLRVPLIGTPFAPVKDKRFVAGLHRWNDRWLHVTKGIGNIYGVRINCRPEVSFLTLT